MVSLSIRREAAAAEICEPAPQIRQDIAELIDTWACLANQPCHKEKIDRAKSLLQNDPDDFLLNRTYQNLVFDLPERDRQTAIGEMLVPYRKKARRIPDDPAVQYLNKGFEQDPEKARARDERFVKKWPGFSWGRLDLAVDVLKSRTWGNDPHDREIGEEHLAIFMRLCPTRYVEALGLMMSDLAFNGGNPAFLREHLPRLRATVEAAPPARTLAYGALWNLEFASALPTDQPRVRSRVKGDLARLKKLRLKSNLNWWTLLREGYTLAGDKASARWAEDGLIAAFPCHFSSVDARLAHCHEDYDARSDGPGRQEENYEALFRTTDLGIRICPDEIRFHEERFRSLSHLPNLTNEQALQEVDHFLAFWEKARGSHYRSPSPFRMAAEFLVDKKLALERVPDLIARENEFLEDLRNSKASASRAGRFIDDRGLLSREADNLSVVIQAEIGLGQTTRAARDLTRMEKLLASLGETDPDDLERKVKARYWRVRGDLAAGEGKGPDALVFYREAEALEPGQDAENRAVRVWKDLGGSDEAWTIFTEGAWGERSARTAIGSRAATVSSDTVPVGWSSKDEGVPPFELVDMNGRTWRPEDLKGKVTLINVWATWCVPCRAELLYVERLFEKVAGRSDLRIITFNADMQAGLVGPYLKENGWRFPVLLAHRYLVRLSGPPSVPQNWIVDRDGVVRYTSMGFDLDQGDAWMGHTLKLLDTVAAHDRQSATPIPTEH